MAETVQRKESLILNADDEIISDETFETMLDAMGSDPGDKDVSELLQAMNENRIITREEAEQILEVETPNKVVKCGLPETVRPSDPENTTDPEECISRILKDDPSLVEVNLNNMKRTPIPVIQRMLMALKDNTHMKRLMLANTALTDAGAEPIIETLEKNTTLEMLNIETNFLTGDFLARLFKAALVNQTIREVKAVNQSTTFGTEAEMEIMHAVNRNRGLTKVSVNLRHPEAKNKVEQACLRNGELRRQQRRIEQQQVKEAAEAAAHPQNNVEKTKPAAKVEEKKPAAVKKDLAKKPAEKPAPVVKKPHDPLAVVDVKKAPEKEKAVEKKVEPAKKVAEKEKVSPKKEPLKKAVEEKPAAAAAATAAPEPPPAPKVEVPPKEIAAEKPAPPKPTLATVSKEAAAKAAARGFGTSSDVTPKKKISIGEKSKPLEPIDTSMPLPTKTRPPALSIGVKEGVPTSKGLGAATFGSTAPKPPTPSKTEPPKGRRGSGTIKPPTPGTDTVSKPWGASPSKPPGSSGLKSTDIKSKADSSSADKPKSYGYGSAGKKRDSIK